METNSLQFITRVVEDAGHSLSQFGPFTLTVVAVLALGRAIKELPWVANRWIPLINLAAGTALFILISDPTDAPYTMRYPIVRHAILGMGAAMVAWALHAKFLKKLKLFNGNGNGQHPTDGSTKQTDQQ